MSNPSGADYILAQSRISAFQSNVQFKDYDIFFLSGIVEGLNERRRHIKCANVETRCSTTTEGLSDPTALDLTWEIDLIKDIIQPSQFGDNNSFVGGQLSSIGQQGSGVFLSKRLINLLRYYTVETSFGALTTLNPDYLDNGAHLYDLGTVLLPNLNENRFFGQVYRTFDTNTHNHYPCGDPHGGSVEQLTNPKLDTTKNVVDVSAVPDTGNDPFQGVHGVFYDPGADLNLELGSGYVGNGDLEIVRAIKTQKNLKANWPVVAYNGNLVDVKILSHIYNDTLTYPQNDNTQWALWTNKKELFKFESDYYNGKIPTDFILNNEYLSQLFPQTNISGGNVFMGIREHFLEIISAISKMAYFQVPVSFVPQNNSENPLITDTETIEGRGSSDWGGCLYAPDPGCSPFTCHFTTGPTCCRPPANPPTISPQLGCGDCGAFRCQPYACVPPSITSDIISTSVYFDPFGGPNPVYFYKTAKAKSDQLGGGGGFLNGAGCPINTLSTNSSERMRAKVINFSCNFTGTMTVAYRLDEFTTTTCDGFSVNQGCVAGVSSLTVYAADLFSFPHSNPILLTDLASRLPAAIAPFDNCVNDCLPTTFGGGGQTKEYRQYMSPIAITTPTFTMIPSNASLPV